jgi:hypothetical protein
MNMAGLLRRCVAVATAVVFLSACETAGPPTPASSPSGADGVRLTVRYDLTSTPVEGGAMEYVLRPTTDGPGIRGEVPLLQPNGVEPLVLFEQQLPPGVYRLHITVLACEDGPCARRDPAGTYECEPDLTVTQGGLNRYLASISSSSCRVAAQSEAGSSS